MKALGRGDLDPSQRSIPLPPPQQSVLLSHNGTSSLPRNLAATLQDIETKRQLALQQKGEWLPRQLTCSPGGPGYLPCTLHQVLSAPAPFTGCFSLSWDLGESRKH